jgi:hypothetical protein
LLSPGTKKHSFKGPPTDLKNMIHLSYLGLRGTGISVIPTWIGNLQNLQTLDIKGTEMSYRSISGNHWYNCTRHVHLSALYDKRGLGGTRIHCRAARYRATADLVPVLVWLLFQVVNLLSLFGIISELILN